MRQSNERYRIRSVGKADVGLCVSVMCDVNTQLSYLFLLSFFFGFVSLNECNGNESFELREFSLVLVCNSMVCVDVVHAGHMHTVLWPNTTHTYAMIVFFFLLH